MSAENAVSQKYVVANGNKMFTGLLDNSEYSIDTLSQKADKDFSPKTEFSEFDHTKVLLALPARGPPSHSFQRQRIETTVMGNTQKLARCMRFKIHDVITLARAALLRDINRKPVVPNHGNTSTQCTETE